MINMKFKTFTVLLSCYVMISGVISLEPSGTWQSKEVLWAMSHQTLVSCSHMMTTDGVGPCTVSTPEDDASIRALVSGGQVKTVPMTYEMLPCSDGTTTRIFAPLSRDPVKFGSVCASTIGDVNETDWNWREAGAGLRDKEFCQITSDKCFSYETYDTGSVRIVGSAIPEKGRLEVMYKGEWGAVCDTEWGDKESTAVCREFGFTSGHRQLVTGYTVGVTKVVLQGATCSESATSLNECATLVWGEHECLDSERVAIVCDNEVRLAGGTRAKGRVEIKHDDEWGTVCHTGWDETDAAVLCKSLGYNVSSAVLGGAFDDGTGIIWMSDLDCIDQDQSLTECSFTGWGSTGCDHTTDAGAICDIAMRLADGSHASGRLEVFYADEWGTVCDDLWDATGASLICQSYGYLSGAPVTGQFGQGTGPIWMDSVTCDQSATRLVDCSHDDWGVTSCTHAEDVGILCDTDMRLINGTYKGTVEVFYDGQWGTICDDSIGDDAQAPILICNKLGFTTGTIVTEAELGEGSGPIWLDEVDCSGMPGTGSLLYCDHDPWGVADCAHSEDIGVICDTDVRMSGGYEGGHEGRVEILYNGQWGTICDNGWDTASGTIAASMVCTKMGYMRGTAAMNALFGQGSGPVHLDGMACNGSETSLVQCPHNGWGTVSCGHSDDVGVFCETDLRLVGGSDSSEGRVEVFYQGEWGTICDDYFNQRAAAIVCGEFGYMNGTVANHFPDGGSNTPIWLSYIECYGSESKLIECYHADWGDHACSHSEDVGVMCENY